MYSRLPGAAALVHATKSSFEPAVSITPAVRPLRGATVERHGACPAAVQGAPVSGPLSTAPDGASRYPVPAAGSATGPTASTRLGDAAFPAALRSLAAPGTGCQLSLVACEEKIRKLAHWAAKSALLPVQPAKSAKARSPAVSRLVTRRPYVDSWAQCAPPSCVTQSSGPNAQPLRASRKRSLLTPADPAGPPVTGALTPYQVWP